MNHKMKWLIGLGITLIFFSACSLLNNLNPLDDIKSEIEDLADELPIDDIQGQIESLTTDLPGELDSLATDLPANLDEITDELETLTTDLPGDLNTLATDIPSEVDDIVGDFEGFINDVLGSDDIPEDIPVVEGEKDDLFASEKIVSYTTSLDFNSVLSFYQEQMLVNGWTVREGKVITEDAALLYFQKNDRQATVTLSYSLSNSKTDVMIIIQEKQ